MVRAFPKACMVILTVDVALCVTTPIPFAEFVVYEIIFDILPTAESLLKGILITEVLGNVIETDNSLSMYPPMAVGIHIASIKISLVRHRAVRIETFL